VFDRVGLTGITMVAVAAEAGVSRRLVYDHFEDLSALYEGFFEERLGAYLAAVDRSASSAGTEMSGVVAAGLQETFRLSATDLASVDLIIRGTGMPELDRPRRRLRAYVVGRWLPVVDPEGADPELGGALLWAVMGSVIGVATQVVAGHLEADRATALALALFEQIPTVLANASANLESGTN
jgi:hypothetical protein